MQLTLSDRQAQVLADAVKARACAVQSSPEGAPS
jgi:hypothetical protein